MTEINRSLIGTEGEPFEVEIERGAIRKFVDAIGDTNPLHRDRDYARQHGYDDVVAPPTFPTCFRPVNDPPWLASLDRRRVVAGQMSFEYVQPITAGMTLTCRPKLLDVVEKSGAKGTMELLHQELQGRDVDGNLVFVMGRTTIYRSKEQIEKRSLA